MLELLQRIFIRAARALMSAMRPLLRSMLA
jgi:hypothetical protein